MIIEQKSIGIALDKPQVGHDGMTPYEQGKMYDNGLPFDEKARWIVTSNFAEIWIYDMNQRRPEPVKIALVDLQSKYHMLNFLVNQEAKKISDEMKVSLQAGELVGKLYDAFYKQYRNPDDPEALKSLNKLCIRIVFCLYAEDAAVFGRKNMFHDYMAQFDTGHARKGLRDLFRVLNQKPEDRDQYLSDDDPLLAAFPYVNGGLFADDDIEIPPFTDEIMNLLLRNASENFNWSGISPTIFGAVFESTLNPETRRSGGMHYTSIENIHKVIDPLFLNDLRTELQEIKEIAVLKTQERRLHEFQDKLATTVLLDPAAGSGNFLTESYLCLRRLENEVLSLLQHGQVVIGLANNPIKVSISQMYGIEINDFAVTVARTALWIAENQMMKETEDIVHMTLDFLPLKTGAHIVEGNALRIDWESVVPKATSERIYICGNPPFVGHNLRSAEQKEDISIVFGKGETESKLDYVICWYQKAIEYMQSTHKTITASFVSTNSICQGESVPAFWKQFIIQHNAEIQFAYPTFVWESEANSKAQVHCVIVGFTCGPTGNKKKIYNGSVVDEVEHINPYLISAPDIWLENRTNKPSENLPKMTTGSQPMDYGRFILDQEERSFLISKYPILEKYIKPFIGAYEFLHDRINHYSRFCFWFENANLSEIKNIAEVRARIKDVQELRSQSKIDRVQKKADVPYLFCQIRQPKSTYLVIPRHSSQSRKYIPIGFMTPDIIAGDACTIIPGLGLYEFGILTSNIHMAWVSAVCGRIKSDYRYQASVYNNFPWPNISLEDKQQIEHTAQEILNVRGTYSDHCLADLYDPSFMPQELLRAHRANDRAVMQAYGMPIKETDEAACVAWLMRLYQGKNESYAPWVGEYLKP